MVVNDLIALLQNAAITGTWAVVFKDSAGNVHNIEITSIGPVVEVSPATTTTPGYTLIQLL